MCFAMKIKQRVSLLLVLALMLGLLSGCGLVTPAPYPEAPVQNVEFTLVEDSPTPEAPAEAPAPAPALPGETALPEESPEPAASAPEEPPAQEPSLDEDGTYTTKEDLALYLHLYGHLPSNFVTKKEARAAGWTGGSVEAFFPGMCIGGDYYGDYEGNLPKAKGRSWQECDVNTLGRRSRGAERIVWSNDGLIYYTGDHYETWELLYGEP